MIARDELGKIFFAEAVWVRARGIPLGIGGWFTEKKRSGAARQAVYLTEMLDAIYLSSSTGREVLIANGS